jgi:hypothetical protein
MVDLLLVQVSLITILIVRYYYYSVEIPAVPLLMFIIIYSDYAGHLIQANRERW